MKNISSQTRLWLLTATIAMLLCASVSCTSTRGTTTRSRTQETTADARRDNKRDHNITGNKKDAGTARNKDATPEQWKTLDIVLSKNDNHALYKEIKEWLGTPYAAAGHQKKVGSDCSGFVMEIYLTVYGIKLERRGSNMLEKNCKRIAKEELREGDLVFFHNGSHMRVSHVGIYLKDNKFAHASSSRGVVIDDLGGKYWVNHYYASGRVKR